MDAPIVEVILGGASNSRDLHDLTTLIGERDETTDSTTVGDPAPGRRGARSAAHYADAISLLVLKKEQHHIEGMLTDIDQRLNAYQDGREDAKLRLRAYLHLATNAHAFYLACDEGRRRLCNQAFFTKITLTEHLEVISEFTGVYEAILDPSNRLHAEFWQRTGQLRPDLDLAHNEAPLPTDHGGRVGTSTK